jgi:hypothetical protein
MALVPDLKKGGTGLRYVKEFNKRRIGIVADTIVYLTCFATNTSSGERTQALMSLDLKDLYLIPDKAEGRPILKPVQVYEVESGS